MRETPFGTATIAVVDDEPANVRVLERLLGQAGYSAVVGMTDPGMLLRRLGDIAPDLVMLDLHMPTLDGYTVLLRLAKLVPADEYLPVLVLTADASRDAVQRALALGANDFLTKPFDANEVLLRVHNLLYTRALHRHLRRENERLEERVRERTQAVERAVEARDAFLVVAAHELRTPLTSARAFAQLLARRLATPAPIPSERVRERDMACRIAGQLDKMRQLIDQLLDLSRLDAGRLLPDRREVDLAELVREIAVSMGVQAGKSRVVVDAPGTLLVWGDRLQLEQVLMSLVSNALRYSPSDTTVRIQVEALDANRGARVSVQDRGIGVAPEHRARLFERYYRPHGDDHRSGLGVGLYLSREIVVRHGGRLEAEFPPEGGSRFVITLPPMPAPSVARERGGWPRSQGSAAAR